MDDFDNDASFIDDKKEKAKTDKDKQDKYEKYEKYEKDKAKVDKYDKDKYEKDKDKAKVDKYEKDKDKEKQKDKYEKDKYEKYEKDKDKEKQKDKEKEKQKDKMDKYGKEFGGKEFGKEKFKEKFKSLKGEKDKVIKGAGQKKRKHKKAKPTWHRYIHNVLKTVHSDDCRLSAKAMSILDSFATDLFERISSEAVRLLRMNNKRTLTSMEIQTAARLVLPGELCKHAIQDGAKAVNKYSMADGS